MRVCVYDGYISAMSSSSRLETARFLAACSLRAGDVTADDDDDDDDDFIFAAFFAATNFASRTATESSSSMSMTEFFGGMTGLPQNDICMSMHEHIHTCIHTHSRNVSVLSNAAYRT